MMNLLSIALLYATLLTQTGVARYQWTCTQANDNEYGEIYIPSVRDYGQSNSVLTGSTNGHEIHIYRVQSLSTECYGEVTAIEFCYEYNTVGSGEPVFNWTVLILEETNIFTITGIISIESHPNTDNEAICMSTVVGKMECCDREYISSFNIQTNNFIFGVTESARGNTHGATLLRFFESQLDYTVHTLLIAAVGQNISVGSTLVRPNTGVQRGLHLLWFVIGVAQYRWNCSVPDDDGERYIPGIEREFDSIVTEPTAEDSLRMYRVQNLNADCTREAVTAIEFCYQYSTDGPGEAVFNWTVLILEESMVFTITRIIAIESHPNELDGNDCTDTGGGGIKCCDRENISSFETSHSNNMFIFGVTESAQGNTHGATLLGAHVSQPEYIVDTLTISATGHNISVGSTLPKPQVEQRGLRLLRFILDSGPAPPTLPTDLDATSSPDLPSTSDQGINPTTTNIPLSTSTTHDPEDRDTTSSLNDLSTTSSPDLGEETNPTTPLSTSSTHEPEDSDSTTSPNYDPGPETTTTVPPSTSQEALDYLPYAMGGAVGATVVIIVIVVTVVIVSLLVSRSRKKSYKLEPNKDIGLLSYDNAMYDVAGGPGGNFGHVATTDLVIPANEHESERFSTAVYDSITEQSKVETLPQDYTLPVSNKSYSMRPTETHYAEASEQVYATTYEVPGTLTSNNTPQTDDENPYMVPATNEHALYSQLSQIRVNYTKRDSIKLTKLLGSGQFGKVHQGEWTAPGSKDKIDVAVKTLKEGAGEDKVKFLQEAAIMGQFSHPNVVKLYGVVTEGEPIMLVIELLPKGDLRELLCSVRSQSINNIDADLPHTLLSYCRQVASGMGYLAGRCFIHRDLAARNILVSEDDVCKIADFGMSRDLDDANYYISHGGIIPVKWTAPEALHYKKYSTTSDVWSFGCVMYEIWSLGHKPFEGSTNLTCVQLLRKGTRLAPPPGCSRKIYKLMMDCWHPDSFSRPDFVSVVQQLSLPDTKLLKWSEEDKATDPEAAMLGAELDKAMDLYKDLQQRYIVTK